MGDGHPLYLAAAGRLTRGIKGTITVASPAAGAEFSVTVPGGQQWLTLAVSALFTTSAQVQNRLVLMNFTDGTNTFLRVGATTSIPASSTVEVSYAVGVSSDGTSGSNLFLTRALPILWLPSGYQIQSLTHLIQTGDQYSAITLYVEQCYTTDQEFTEHAQDRDEYRRELQQELAGSTGIPQPNYR